MINIWLVKHESINCFISYFKRASFYGIRVGWTGLDLEKNYSLTFFCFLAGQTKTYMVQWTMYVHAGLCR